MDARLIGYQDRFALIQIDDDIIKIPQKLLPNEVKIGENLLIKFATIKDNHNEELSRMKIMLQELIN